MKSQSELPKKIQVKFGPNWTHNLEIFFFLNVHRWMNNESQVMRTTDPLGHMRLNLQQLLHNEVTNITIYFLN